MDGSLFRRAHTYEEMIIKIEQGDSKRRCGDTLVHRANRVLDVSPPLFSDKSRSISLLRTKIESTINPSIHDGYSHTKTGL